MSSETIETVTTKVATETKLTTPEVPVVEAATEAPAAQAIIEEPEQVYAYQPTDEQGRSLGGKQVIKYRTQAELVEKITNQNVLLVRKLREETRNRRLGVTEDEHIPDTALRFDDAVEFVPRSLSADERFQLSRDLLDPETCEEASSKLFEATVGVRPQIIAKTLSDMQLANQKLMARAEADAFVSANPDYYKCQENFHTLTNWMLKNNLRPVRDNFQLAFSTLKAVGLLLEAPIVREEVPTQPVASAPVTSVPTPETTVEPTPANTQPVQDDAGRITSESPAQQRRPVSHVATGLTRHSAGDAGTAVNKQGGYTLAEINAMSSDAYRRKLASEKGFAETVERLEREAAEARSKRR